MRRFRALLDMVYRQPGVLTGAGEMHEKSFEELLQRHELSYVRHPLGKRRTPDFSVLGIPVELKSSKSSRVFLNDSYFSDDYLYVMTAQGKSIISFGKDLCSEEEKDFYKRYVCELKEFRKRIVSTDRLVLFPRSATQFSVAKLDREELFQKVKSFLSK